MTKTIVVPGNPPPDYTLNIAINSIVAAAKTAHDLESARRKATRDSAVDSAARGFMPSGSRPKLGPVNYLPN
jgi:hypothetical protein